MAGIILRKTGKVFFIIMKIFFLHGMAVSRICMFPVKNMPAAVCPGTPAGACCIWIIC